MIFDAVQNVEGLGFIRAIVVVDVGKHTTKLSLVGAIVGTSYSKSLHKRRLLSN